MYYDFIMAICDFLEDREWASSLIFHNLMPGSSAIVLLRDGPAE